MKKIVLFLLLAIGWINAMAQNKESTHIEIDEISGDTTHIAKYIYLNDTLITRIKVVVENPNQTYSNLLIFIDYNGSCIRKGDLMYFLFTDSSRERVAETMDNCDKRVMITLARYGSYQVYEISKFAKSLKAIRITTEAWPVQYYLTEKEGKEYQSAIQELIKYIKFN